MNQVLLTDLYQITMAYSYWKNEIHDNHATFHLFYRRAPFGESAAIVAGVCPALDYLENLEFTDNELAYLTSLTGKDNKPLFEADFLNHLKTMEWKLDVEAIPEGNLALPNEPILRVSGPILQCQLVETALLNMINFQTLVATKAARICTAAKGDDVMEFGLRRAQGPDGAISASRAAYIGGCMATSNVLAGYKYGIPVKGTHAHSWVMSFEDEQEAFEAYAKALPNNVILLVDTYDTIEGVKKAVQVAKKLNEQGHDLLGIRLDSGDLAELSVKARKILDEAGMQNAKIVASNDLDEYSIEKLKAKGAKIDVWGIGTKLVTSYDQPALGGVYKLGAIENDHGNILPKVKLSNDPIKVSNPGTLQVARITSDKQIIEDIIYDEIHGIHANLKNKEFKNLLQPALRKGARVLLEEELSVFRNRATQQWQMYKKQETPTPVTLDPYVAEVKAQLIEANR